MFSAPGIQSLVSGLKSLVVAIGAAGILAETALSQSFPARPIRIIVLNTPGSGADIHARLMANAFTETWGQQVVVDNRPGGGGNVGCEITARSAPDGYTLLMITSQQPIVVGLYKNLSYDLIRDFSPISLTGTAPFLLAVNPSVPAASVKELVALAAARPGQLNYGSSGAGSSAHLATELFAHMAGGIKVTHVPYKGSPQALADTISGQVQLTFFVAPVVLPLMKAGKVRALGITSLKRSPVAPDMPPIAESVPGYEWIGWYGLLAPARTPREIIGRLNDAQVKALKGPELQKRLLDLGVTPLGSTPEEYSSYLRAEIEKMRVAIKLSGARAE